MLKRLITAIARILTMTGGVTPTQPAGRAPQEPTQPSGKVSSASATKHRKSSPARTPRKPKQEAAQPTTVARKPGKKKPTARQVAMVSQSKPTGSKSKTPASKTRQHVK
jgi:hypothetical protein